MANSTDKYALYLPDWSHTPGEYPVGGQRVTPSEYLPGMERHLFCPECFAPLFRSPKGRDRSSAGKSAYFAHTRSVRPPCSIRTKPTEGRRYENEEEARKAIEDGRLVILSEFMQDRPEGPRGEAGEYDQGPVEDMEGPLASVPIARHRGESFLLPSRISTIAGMCRNFDENFDKYFVMPGAQYAVPLRKLLFSVEDVSEPNAVPRLYFGKITGHHQLWTSAKWKTALQHSAPGVGDFCLKLRGSMQAEKGISKDSVGRFLLMFGPVTINGSGLCLENLGYGEFALLPQQYEYLLE
ncbi:hypothetical protein JOD97_005580 [Duganella sp. 1411]|uniref:hypothetical protein n=1 Tax=Duganella sp. 1411 TaxID=2806572 RepID=UPI001B72C9CD|nr:hypothetical protein [Duganella sp. 1411]MBP1207500.1 hypothetical protein [Duganella sp. 1411]